MSDITRGADDDAANTQQESALTVEDAGTTTDPADLVDDDSSAASTAPAGGGAADDDSIGHVFDQTNGVADGLDGDSDGTVESDTLSRGERDQEEPVIDGQEIREDREGSEDLRDPNP